MFGGLFDNPTLKKLAFSGLRRLADEEQIRVIVLVNNPLGIDGPIPGFDVQMFREPMQVFDMDTVGLSREQFATVQRVFATLEKSGPIDDEVLNIIERYHKAKTISNGDIATEGNSDTASGSTASAEARD